MDSSSVTLVKPLRDAPSFSTSRNTVAWNLRTSLKRRVSSCFFTKNSSAVSSVLSFMRHRAMPQSERALFILSII